MQKLGRVARLSLGERRDELIGVSLGVVAEDFDELIV